MRNDNGRGLDTAFYYTIQRKDFIATLIVLPLALILAMSGTLFKAVTHGVIVALQSAPQRKLSQQTRHLGLVELTISGTACHSNIESTEWTLSLSRFRDSLLLTPKDERARQDDQAGANSHRQT